MNHDNHLSAFAPLFQKDEYSKRDTSSVAPFFTNLDKSVYVPLIFSPELIGALCSRASRAQDDLRLVFIKEFILPFLEPKDGQMSEHNTALRELISFLHRHPPSALYSNPRARSFYVKWLAQYGDDSIAQMAGSHLVFWGLSQVATKHFEDQRIGISPIEKSTRYVDYSRVVKGRYIYYTDPTLQILGLSNEYEAAMDRLFQTYVNLKPKLLAWLKRSFPTEHGRHVDTKVLDILRGLLPTSTLSQVAFFGNGQAFEHMINRSAKHPLGEIRWAAKRAFEELYKVTPAFLRRLQENEKQEIVGNYQEYLAGKHARVNSFIQELFHDPIREGFPEVRLIEWDPIGEEKIIAGILYSAPENHLPWSENLDRARCMSVEEKTRILDAYLQGRTERWQKVGRAFENAYVRFEIVMNIGAWRDIHRHRILTQQRQIFSCHHGYDVPQEIVESGLEPQFRDAIDPIQEVFQRIQKHDLYLSQYSVSLAHRIRFTQWENIRQAFWEIELRTQPEGHSDYRYVEQEKLRLLKDAYPLIAGRVKVNLRNYDFPRRNAVERISRKIESLRES